MKMIKKIISSLVIIGVIYCLVYYHNSINNYIVNHLIYHKEISTLVTNQYAKKQNYNFVSITDNFEPENEKQLINVIYTILDSGMSEFTFYCSNKYTNCLSDIDSISNNTDTLTVLNNFVNPFNSFNKLYINSNSMGKVTVLVDKLYSSDEITYVNNKIDEITKQMITSNMTIKDKIKAFHDYIINNTVYDETTSNQIKDNIYADNAFGSNKATGVLENHVALCSGYTDTMAIFLDRLGVENYKVATEDHIWNGVYLDKAWYHLDLTWDDPVTSDGSNLLIYDFFLITNSQLLNIETTQHTYDKAIYSEMTTN